MKLDDHPTGYVARHFPHMTVKEVDNGLGPPQARPPGGAAGGTAGSS